MDCPEITITTTEKAHPNIKFNLLDSLIMHTQGMDKCCPVVWDNLIFLKSKKILILTCKGMFLFLLIVKNKERNH